MPAPNAPSATKTTPFTFTVRLDQEGWEGMEIACQSEGAAIEAAREVLQAKIDLRPILAGAAHRGVVGVGMGSMIEAPDRVIWLGEWEWSAAEGWSWTSSD